MGAPQTASGGAAYMFAGLSGVDCNANAVADGCDLHAGMSVDGDGNGVPDECDCPGDLDGDGTVGVADLVALVLAWGPCPMYADCNGSGISDALEIAAGSSQDCNCNGVPDECEIESAEAEDCNLNGVPDECEPDCNDSGMPDDCDINGGRSPDHDGNGIPDECDRVINDECQSAFPIGDGSVFFSTALASLSGPIGVICGGSGVPLENDIWFLYSAPCTGLATFSLCNVADFDTVLAIYGGSGCPEESAINPLACSNDAPGCGATSEVDLFVGKGGSYLVRIASPEGSGGGLGTLTVSCRDGP
jgi:hypothetical protein